VAILFGWIPTLATLSQLVKSLVAFLRVLGGFSFVVLPALSQNPRRS
jgi:hypothetical protein